MPAAEDRLTEQEQRLLLSRLHEQLSAVAERYLGRDNTSLRVETARELLKSILYTIQTSAAAEGLSRRELLHADLDRLLHAGQDVLLERKQEMRRLWKRLCLRTPMLRNGYYLDTLKELGRFFDRYEVYYAAHDIPCEIDYPLLLPVNEALQGIDYIEVYLKQLALENELLRSFRRPALLALYHSCYQEPQEEMFNLLEQPLTNAIGVTLLGGDPAVAVLTERQQEELLDLLFGRLPEELAVELGEAAEEACGILCPGNEPAGDYGKAFAQGLAVRVFEAVRNGDISQVFRCL